MEKIGSILKEKRKERGLYLEDIAATTKIHISVLKSIENNELSNLGGAGYTKVLLTSYCKALELEQQEIDRLINNASFKENDNPRQPKEVLHPPTILFHNNIFLIILLVIVSIILVMTIRSLYQKDQLGFPIRENREELLEEVVPDTTDSSILNDLELDQALESDEMSQSDESEIISVTSIDNYESADNETEDVAAELKGRDYLYDLNDYVMQYLEIEDHLLPNSENETHYSISF